jgi:hypothetical protein
VAQLLLKAANDANRSGNYTVLHDLAAPDAEWPRVPKSLAQVAMIVTRERLLANRRERPIERPAEGGLSQA